MTRAERKQKTEYEYNQYLLTGIVIPIAFDKPIEGWEYDETTKWKHLCKNAYLNTDKIKNQSKQYRIVNKEKLDVAAGIYYENNKIKIKEWNRLYGIEKRLKNKDKIKEDKRAYYIKNKDDIIKTNSIRRNKRRKHDTIFNFKEYVSDAIRYTFRIRGYRKTTNSEKILGCTKDEFVKHLTSLFSSDMNLENHGTVWQIDHIIPVASCMWAPGTDDEIKDRIVRLNHYTNLQPLLVADNASKHDKIMDWTAAKKFEWIVIPDDYTASL